MWGKPCLAYNVQASFPVNALGAIAAVQDHLNALSLPQLKCPPPQAQHVSIYALVPVRWPDAGKEVYWNEISAAAISSLQALCAGRRRFKLRFDRLRLTPSAIIAVAAETPGLIADIREHFHRAPGHLHLPKPDYDIVHTTLARFDREEHVSAAVIRKVSTTDISLTMEVEHLCLVRECVYPSLVLDEMVRFDLR